MANIAKKYATALIEGLENKALQELLSKKGFFVQCLKQESFKEVLSNPFLHSERKVDFVVECLGIKDTQTKHSLLIMAKSERLILLEEILEEAERLLNSDKKQCHATLFSSERIDRSLVELFQKQLEAKLGYQVSINEALWDKQEVKCCVEELDLEISFSKEKFDRDLKNFILVSFLQGVQIEN